jgi:hypothetical protein
MISMEEKIAIVIPAYKCRFLRQTLDSIVVQTCRSFTVYIGDDASPQNLKEIVSDYADKMNIVYRRFDTNLGGVDLPGHWDRCIALAKEPVVWFFSDDDLMPQDGVERISASRISLTISQLACLTQQRILGSKLSEEGRVKNSFALLSKLSS